MPKESEQKDTIVKVKEPVISARKTETRETPSIFNRKAHVEETRKEETPSILDKKKEDFSEEELKNAWAKFQNGRPEAGETEKLIMGREVKKGANYDVFVFLSSQLEASFLEKFDTELIQFLRNELNNDYLSIKTQVAQQEETKKLYTSKDIYDYMVK
ncbi:MAG: hypothetical protein AAGA66_19240, partial [Bacteroidota bacterium]